MPYSARPEAIAMRARRLSDDILAGKEAQRLKRHRGRKRIADLTSKARIRLGFTQRAEASKQAKVLHHLSRGRDAGDIAVRESWLMSDVLGIIDRIKQTHDACQSVPNAALPAPRQAIATAGKGEDRGNKTKRAGRPATRGSTQASSPRGGNPTDLTNERRGRKGPKTTRA